ncbi:MAG: FmdB family zinc ribbon protein [bacterium]
MPVYEYECQNCGNRFDIEHGINEVTRKRCPECRGKIKKCFSAVGIVFKGSGFYVTDSKGKNPASKPAACSSCDVKAETGGECKAAAACGTDSLCASKTKTS